MCLLHHPAASLLLILLDQALGFAVLPLQGLILGLCLLQVLVHSLAQALSLHPVSLQLLHTLLVVLQGLLQLGLIHTPALLLLLRVVQLRGQVRRPCHINRYTLLLLAVWLNEQLFNMR